MHAKAFAIIAIVMIALTGIVSAEESFMEDLINDVAIVQGFGDEGYTDAVADPTIYRPCVGCYGPSPTPAPYEKIGVSFSVSNSAIKLGRSVTLSGSQISGTPVGSSAMYQFVAQNGGDYQVMKGQTVTFTPKKVGTYWIQLTIRDEAQRLSGATTIKGALTVTQK